jgi:hypothetical protein
MFPGTLGGMKRPDDFHGSQLQALFAKEGGTYCSLLFPVGSHVCVVGVSAGK